MVTQVELKKLLSYDVTSGVFTWRSTCKVAGNLHHKGYERIGIKGKSYLSHRLAWLYVHGYFPETQVDHINGVRNDNSITNLREVSQQCNLRNTKVRSDNTSGVKGVYRAKGTALWVSCIRIDTKSFYLGCSYDKVEAIALRLAVEQCIGWQTCESQSSAKTYMEEYYARPRSED